MNWFHKKDGGLMVAHQYYTPLYDELGKKPNEYLRANFGYVCAICGYFVYNPNHLIDQKCARFFDLSEALQAAALGEML